MSAEILEGEGCCVVSVADDGPGLPEAVLSCLDAGTEGASRSPWPSRGGLRLRLCVELTAALETRLEFRIPLACEAAR